MGTCPLLLLVLATCIDNVVWADWFGHLSPSGSSNHRCSRLRGHGLGIATSINSKPTSPIFFRKFTRVLNAPEIVYVEGNAQEKNDQQNDSYNWLIAQEQAKPSE